MRVIDEAAVGYVFEQTRLVPDQDAIPSYVWDFQSGAKPRAGALEAAEPGRLRGFLTSMKHPLQANTDSEKRAASGNSLLNRFRQLQSAERFRCQKVANSR